MQSGVSGPQGSQRPKKRGTGVHWHAAWQGCGLHAVCDDVEHVTFAHARRLELPRVGRVQHALLVAEAGGGAA